MHARKVNLSKKNLAKRRAKWPTLAWHLCRSWVRNAGWGVGAHSASPPWLTRTAALQAANICRLVVTVEARMAVATLRDGSAYKSPVGRRPATGHIQQEKSDRRLRWEFTPPWRTLPWLPGRSQLTFPKLNCRIRVFIGCFRTKFISILLFF